jgi:predicted DNA-binding protein
MTKFKKPRGRPPKPREVSDLVADQPRITVRLPIETKARLMALSTVTGRAAWQLIDEALDLLWRDQDDETRGLAARLSTVLAGQYVSGEE